MTLFAGEGACDRCGNDGVVLYAHYLPEACCANCIAELFEDFRLLLIEEEETNVRTSYASEQARDEDDNQ